MQIPPCVKGRGFIEHLAESDEHPQHEAVRARGKGLVFAMNGMVVDHHAVESICQAIELVEKALWQRSGR